MRTVAPPMLHASTLHRASQLPQQRALPPSSASSKALPLACGAIGLVLVFAGLRMKTAQTADIKYVAADAIADDVQHI